MVKVIVDGKELTDVDVVITITTEEQDKVSGGVAVTPDSGGGPGEPH